MTTVSKLTHQKKRSNTARAAGTSEITIIRCVRGGGRVQSSPYLSQTREKTGRISNNRNKKPTAAK